MYNRYIPQPDGSYRRNQIQDIPSQPEVQIPMPPPPVPKRETEPTPCGCCMHNPAPKRPAPHREQRPREINSVPAFLKQLLPKDFGVEDLVVVLLLLLMAGDCRENQNTALLTLVLYLFL